jgi:hypothetical protein
LIAPAANDSRIFSPIELRDVELAEVVGNLI